MPSNGPPSKSVGGTLSNSQRAQKPSLVQGVRVKFETPKYYPLQGPPAGGRGPAKTYIRLEIMGPGPRKWATFVDLNHSL